MAIVPPGGQEYNLGDPGAQTPQSITNAATAGSSWGDMSGPGPVDPTTASSLSSNIGETLSKAGTFVGNALGAGGTLGGVLGSGIGSAAGGLIGGKNGAALGGLAGGLLGGSGALSGVFNKGNPVTSALSAVGNPFAKSGPSADVAEKSATTVRFATPKDWRVRISLPDKSAIDTNNDVFAPIRASNGVMFPYTPTVSMTHKANYASQKVMHSNYTSFSYENSEVSEISITGDFTVQSIQEGKYLLAVLYFFRSVTKMFFGSNKSSVASLAGNPPPLVFLNGFGPDYFPSVMCAVTSFAHNMPNDVDYIEIPGTGSTSVRLPALSSISVLLQPVYSRQNVYQNFDLKKFASGGLLDRGFI